MEPIYPIIAAVPIYYGEPASNFNAFPAFYNEILDNGDKILSNLDSDTRAYVKKHTSNDRTKQDIINCIQDLKNYP